MSLFNVTSAVIAVVALCGYANAKLIRLPDSIGITAVALIVSLATVALGAASPAVARWAHVVPATAGVVISTAIVGCAFYYAARLLGTPLRLIDCLVFGALISPTDPIAALGLLGRAKVPESLLTTITGGFLLLRSIDSHAVEILITLAMATGGYALASALGVSAPIATVVMGLVIGNRGREHAMSELTRERLFTFWDLADNLLNLLLFGLIGLELTALAGTSLEFASLAAIAIPIALAGRLASVAIPISILGRFARFEPSCVQLLTWAGLRGALAIALALSLPKESAARAPIATATYAIALFSTLVQATTVEPLARHWTHRSQAPLPPPG